jgi:DNA invertase Pin-like site-specific DNA recombinase
MIVGYARVSSTDQTPQFQIDALKAAKCKPIYIEQRSGKNMDRPELTRCLDTLRKGDTLVIWKLDHLGRSLRDLLEIVERLENSGVQFISLTEDINTKGASGRLIFPIFAVLAEFERNLIRKRTKAGLARARARLGGARRKTTKKQDEGMRALWDSRKFTAAELAKQFGSSAPTFFRRMRPKSLKMED